MREDESTDLPFDLTGGIINFSVYAQLYRNV